MSKSLTVFAPAKINLHLHITGRRDNGYHTLDSLVGFADIGDEIQIEAGQNFSFEICGPFAGAFKGKDLDTTPQSSNLVVRAVWALAKLAGKAPSCKVMLTKNLPLGAGLGGGSADAAATLWGLLEYWDLPRDLEGLSDLMVSLGADVPICFSCESVHMSGIGEILQSTPALPEFPIVLVHPGQACNTAKIFSVFGSNFGAPVLIPEHLDNPEDTLEFLKTTQNMLTNAAIKTAPEIRNVLNALESQSDCGLARMSGSGSACFGIFYDIAHAEKAAKTLANENPDWWVKTAWIGRVERY